MMEKNVSIEDLKKQENLAVSTADLLLAIEAEIKNLEDKLSGSVSNSNQKYGERLRILKKGEERYDQPKLLEHTEYLYKMITAAPQVLGEDALKRFEELEKEFLEYKTLYL